MTETLIHAVMYGSSSLIALWLFLRVLRFVLRFGRMLGWIS